MDQSVRSWGSLLWSYETKLVSRIELRVFPHTDKPRSEGKCFQIICRGGSTRDLETKFVSQIELRVFPHKDLFHEGRIFVTLQSQKTQGFVSQILRHYLTEEGHVRKLFSCVLHIKKPCVRNSGGLTRSKILGILQTDLAVPALFINSLGTGCEFLDSDLLLFR